MKFRLTLAQVILFGISLVSTACSSNSPYLLEGKKIGRTHYVLTMDGSKRSIIIQSADQTVKEKVAWDYSLLGGTAYNRETVPVPTDAGFCAEPAPDAMGTLATQYAANLAVQAGAITGSPIGSASLTGGTNGSTTTGVFELFQRSQGVQVLRDGLYRLCEAYLNGALEKEQYKEHLINLVTTLNYVVPIEICSKIHNINSSQERIIVDEPKESSSPPDNKTKSIKIVPSSFSVNRTAQSDLIKDCISRSEAFAKAAQSYSTTVRNTEVEFRRNQLLERTIPLLKPKTDISTSPAESN